MKKYEYRVVSTMLNSSLTKKLNSLAKKGWKVAGFSFNLINRYTVLLERELRPPTPTASRQRQKEEKLRTIPVADVSEDDNYIYIGD